MKIAEGVFLIIMIGIVLSNPTGFSTAVTGAGQAYRNAVSGLTY